ncbi:M48 family metallopeptidase [Sphingomonas crusticola]|uniref:M48 family metallopeptidase n=1 Tax=Sphingomonas crusticola TaxID=1697973 RepID=UPI0013C2A4CA|nr:M48 family metallopeptidase [Sphingomonas crusticola]
MLGLLVLAGLFGTLQSADGRVAAVAWRLQTANAALCRDIVPLAGFSVQTLDQFSPALRAQASSELGLGDLPQVSAVVPGSAAARAGIKPGDNLRAIDGVAMPRPRGGPANYAASEAVERALAKALEHPPARLEFGSRTIELAGDPGCASQVQLVPEPKFDASADGHYVQISGPMYEFAAADEELAFIIAHELAHNIFPEAKRVPGGGAGQRAAELAADRMAIWMMARAGYEVSQTPAFVARLGRKRALSWLDGTHPRWKLRISAVSAAATAVRARRESGQALSAPF